MKVLLLLALAAVGHCALLGSKKCTYGPSYWCSHLHHAKECNAMQHCMTTVWKNQKLDTMIGSSETCFDVIKVLDVVRHATDADFMDQWVMGCTGMPLEKRQICKELTMDDMAEVYKLLKSDLSSRQIAAALKLCGGYEDTVSHPEQKPVSGDYCKDCVNFMEDLREMFNNSEGQAVAMIKGLVCTNMGSLQSLCNQLVDQYGDMVFSYVMQVVNPQKICQALQLCSNQTHAELMERLKHMMAMQQWGDVECDLCKTLDAEAQKALSDSTFQNDVFAYVKADVCSLFGSFADKCSSYVDSIGPLVFQVLVSEMDPEKTCQALHVCPAGQVPVSLFKTVKYKVTKHKLASEECDACKTVVGDIQKELSDATVQKEVLTFLKDNLCSRLGSLATQCNTYVDAYGPVLFQILVAEMNPQDICKAIHLCTNQTNANLLKIILRKMDKGGIECELCQNLAKELQTLLQDATVQNETLTFLKNDVCTILASFATECRSYVDAYGPMVFQIVVAELDPVTICQTVGLCNATASSQLTRVPLGPLGMVQILPPHNNVQTNPIECELCKKLVEELKGIIAGKSEEEAKAAMEKLCNDLPSELSGECIQFVDEYGDMIIKAIFDELSPDLVCSKIGVCPSEAFVLAVGLQVATKSEKCAVCKEAIDYVKKEVNSSAARAFEKNMLDKVCTGALSKYGWMCQWFVDKYAPAIINMFEEKADPAAICSVLDLCGQTQAPSASDSQPLIFQPMLELQPARPHLLGTKQCMYGPSFWCASESNARLCNAEAECKRMKEMENQTKK